MKSPGARIDATTPTEATLTSSATNLNLYDVVMLPCQGSPNYTKSRAQLANLIQYANAGGRVDPSATYPSVSPTYPPPGTYACTLTATAGTLTRTATYQLKVTLKLAHPLLGAFPSNSRAITIR